MAHEIAHVYWACDEYNSPHLRTTGCASCDVNRDALNGNGAASDTSCTIPLRRHKDCLMSNSTGGYSLVENDFDTEVEKLCWFTREQIGWATTPQAVTDPTNRTYCWNDVNWNIPNQAMQPRVWEAQYFNDARLRMPLTHWTGAPRHVRAEGTPTTESLSVNFLTNPLNSPCIIGTGTTTPRTQYFSVRFRRMINFPAGDYEFTATTGIDAAYPRVDEVRIYVKNVQLKPSATTPGKFEKIRIDGETLVQVDYFQLEVSDPRVEVSWVRVGSTSCTTPPTFFADLHATQVYGTDLCDLNTPSIIVDVTGVGGVKPYRVTAQRNNDQPITHEMPEDLLLLQPVPILGDSRYKIIALTDSTGCPANVPRPAGMMFNIDAYSPRVNSVIDVKKTTGCTYQASWKAATICQGVGGTIKYTLEREETSNLTTTTRTLFTCQAKLFHDNSDLVPGVNYVWKLTAYRVPDVNASCDSQPKREYPKSSELLMPSCSTAAPTLTTSAISANYGQRVTLSARLLGSGLPLSNRIITFELGGRTVGSASTNANGDAALVQTISLTPGLNSGAVVARFAGDATWNLSSAANDVTVSSTCLPADITTQPSDVTISSGGSAPLSVGTSGTAPITVKWYIAGGGYVGSSNPLQISLTESAAYYAMVSNSCRTTQSRTATITVCNPPAITVQPNAGPTVTSGTAKTLSVTATGTETLFYRWYKDGVAITGATAKTYNFTATASANYHVVVTNGCGSVASSTVTVNVCSAAPTIATQPQNANITYGGNTTLSVTPGGVTPAFQWYQGSSAITGATSSTLNVAPTVTTTYKVVVSNTCGSVTSNTVTVDVCKPPAITSNPANKDINSGQSATLTAGASGTNLTYQWYYSTGTAIAGATSSSITVSPTVTTSYYMKATNTCGTAQTATRTVTVCVPPTITTEPVAVQINAGQSATLTCYASSNVGKTQQWYTSNGTAISGATSTSLTVNPAATTYYYCLVTNSCGSDKSRTVPVTVCEPMQILQQPSDRTITAGQ